MSLIRILLITVLCLLSRSIVFAQQNIVDSLVLVASNMTTFDTATVKLYIEIARRYQSINPEKSLPYASKAIDLATNLNNLKLLGASWTSKGNANILLGRYKEALACTQEAFKINSTLGDKKGLANNYNNFGLIYASITDYPKALDYYYKSLEENTAINNTAGKMNNYANIGNMYNSLQQPQRAIEFYLKALALSDEMHTDAQTSAILNNIGNSYTTLKEWGPALEYKLKALELIERSDNQLRIATSLANLGNLYLKIQEYDKAKDFYNRALTINTRFNNKKGLLACFHGIGEFYLATNQYDSAQLFLTQAYHLALSYETVSEQVAILEQFSLLFEKKMEYDSAYFYYRDFIRLQSSLDKEEKLSQITQSSLKHEFTKIEDSLKQEQIVIDTKLQQQILIATQQQQKIKLQEAEKQIQHLAFLKTQADLKIEQNTRSEKEKQLELVEKEKQIQNADLLLQEAKIEIQGNVISRQNSLRLFYLIGLGLLTVLLFFIFRNFQIQKKTNKIIGKEKEKSDTLLLNILPNEVANELKEKGSSAAKYYEDVSVIFTDFVGFTKIAESLTPQQLVNELHICFTAFDAIVLKHGVEKIKTIGDAYMAVSGLPISSTHHALAATQVAFEFLAFIEHRRKTESIGFEIRIGIHSGPVVAGIVGTKKFAYDIWGDTVNIASRMESSGFPGKINISADTFRHVSAIFDCQSRGKIIAKNKGEMDMYFVSQKPNQKNALFLL